MEKKVKTIKEIRQRKSLLIMPLLVLPFLTMTFWAFGGGKGQETKVQAEVRRGFNINLPDANLKDNKQMDKLSYYNQAQQDSLKLRELERNDPNYKDNVFKDGGESVTINDSFLHSDDERGLNGSLYGSRKEDDPKTERIYQKLAELDKEMSKPVSPKVENNENDMYSPYSTQSNSTKVNTKDVERLEQMMNTINQPASDDQELNQLDGMLDKILDVQHPDRVLDRLKKTSLTNRGKVFAITSQLDNNYITRLDTSGIVTNMTNSFYSFNDAKTVEDVQNSVRAVIHQSQTVVDGSTVELRLIDDVYINGIRIPKDKLIYGIASLNGERLNIKITSIRYKNSLFPVEISVYDLDGLSGVHIPGAITRDVAKQSAERSMQTLGLASLDPSWQAQAAGAGIEAAKTLFSKKVRMVETKVKAGYQVLLKNDEEK